jgi:isopenicillin N synthase-like dioxygenase
MKIRRITYKAVDFYKQVYESVRDTGFAVVKDAPVNQEIIRLTYDSWKSFFASEEKHRYRSYKDQRGYFPLSSENAKNSEHKDPKEFYHLYRNDRLPDGMDGHTHILFELLDQFASEILAGLDYHVCRSLAWDKGLGLAGMARFSPSTLLRILHYPPNPTSEVRAGAHEDICLITVLPMSTGHGLQVQDRSGGWHDVGCDSGEIVVNSGDMMEVVTAGHLKATTHRVIAPGDLAKESRHSIALFVHPKPEVELKPGLTAQQALDQRLVEIGIKK